MNIEYRIVNCVLLYLLTFVVCSLLFVFPISTFAQTTSPTPATTSKPTLTPTPTSAPQQEEGTSSVREKVRETIENLAKKPKGVVGNLAQVTDSTLVIKTFDDKTAQVATTNETKYARIGTDNKRNDIKFADLTLGSFIVAMGYRNGNEIVEAKRVLTYDKKPFINKQVITGKVQEFSKNKITLLQDNNNQWTINLSSKTTVLRTTASGGMEDLKTADIEIGDKLIVSGIIDKKDNTMLAARDVYIFTNVKPLETKATSSPKPTTTPFASPKPSPTPGIQ